MNYLLNINQTQKSRPGTVRREVPSERSSTIFLSFRFESISNREFIYIRIGKRGEECAKAKYKCKSTGEDDKFTSILVDFVYELMVLISIIL